MLILQFLLCLTYTNSEKYDQWSKWAIYLPTKNTLTHPKKKSEDKFQIKLEIGFEKRKWKIKMQLSTYIKYETSNGG